MKKLLCIALILALMLTTGTFVMAEEAAAAPKYVFLFIGDGQGIPQITAAQFYLGTMENPDASMPVPGHLSFTQFPYLGMVTTYDATSFCPDSSSTASAMASGEKILSGSLNFNVELTDPLKIITEYIKESGTGRKVGVATSVSLDHATPSAFYAKAASRSEYYNIATQGMGENSVLDYLAGGAFVRENGPDGVDENVYEIGKRNGFNIVDTNEGIRALNSESGKTLVLTPGRESDGSLHYAIDSERRMAQGEDVILLKDLVEAGINVLDNENGFFFMVEGGKVDWAGHANDAVTSIRETLNFSDAINVAIQFASEHPDETLIVVTGDHETGGLTIGFATTKYDTHFNYLYDQTISFYDFDKVIEELRAQGAGFTAALAEIEKYYGLTMSSESPLYMTEADLERLEYAFNLSMIPEDDRELTAADTLAYGGYEPLSMAVCHILNNKAGIAYTSYSHTGLQLPVYATGVGAEKFAGLYDNTDIFFKMADVMNLEV
ncbi:MAG: alkaline phosphatase [Clostridia bacterium]|nr:alkaline phosphatase [Clostridia bacterium]